MEERAAIAATPVENKAGFSHLDLSRTQLDTGPCRTRCDAVEPIRSRRRLIHYSTRSSKAESSENKSGREGGREGERERERESCRRRCRSVCCLPVYRGYTRCLMRRSRSRSGRTESDP